MKKMLDFYLLIGLVDENFINELSPGLLPGSIKLSGPLGKGVVERMPGKAQNLGSGCFKRPVRPKKRKG